MTKSELKKLIKETLSEMELPDEPDDFESVKQKLMNAEVVRVDKDGKGVVFQLRDPVTNTIFDAKLI